MSQVFDFAYSRSYRGPIQAVIFDWAGTTVDFGCLAPAAVFVEVFARRQVPISLEEARGPMGMPKKDHIRTLTRDPGIARRWRDRYGRAPSEADVEAMYADFVPLQLECLAQYAQLIAGTAEVVAELRRRGVRIGSTTGYSSAMTAINLREAAAQGYAPDVTVSADEVPAGRPKPHMALLAAIRLGVDCVQACVKVDDTVPGIEEGLNAGMWTVGVAVSGNEVGLSLDDWQALPQAEKEALRARACRRLLQSGAHYVVDTMADLLPCIDDIGARIRRGEKP